MIALPSPWFLDTHQILLKACKTLNLAMTKSRSLYFFFKKTYSFDLKKTCCMYVMFKFSMDQERHENSTKSLNIVIMRK